MEAKTSRRRLFMGSLAAWLASVVPLGAAGRAQQAYGLIGRMTAAEGQRDRLVELLVAGTTEMRGCLSYDVAADVSDENTLWITEVWRSSEDHLASLKLPAVREAISAARGLIVDMERVAETRPVIREEL